MQLIGYEPTDQLAKTRAPPCPSILIHSAFVTLQLPGSWRGVSYLFRVSCRALDMGELDVSVERLDGGHTLCVYSTELFIYNESFTPYVD